jgi:putative endonuclease
VFNNIEDAIHREKQLKNWHRQWKINLIDSVNKEWKDLSIEFIDRDAETSSA